MTNIQLAYDAALAAYSPTVGQKIHDYEIVSLVEADHAKAATAPAAHQELVQAAISGGPMGFVANNGTDLLIAFRGTETRGEWIKDAEILPESCPMGIVHSGFWSVYLAIQGSLDRSINDVITVRAHITAVGHSLGAALATLAEYHWYPIVHQVVTFGSPKVFTKRANLNTAGFNRIANHWDIVPHLPLSIPGCEYEHVGTPLLVDSGFTPDLHTAHSLESGYLPGLKKAGVL